MHLKNKNTQTPYRRAFSLTEIAIVLGVMGLILATIWSTYSQVMQANKVKQAATDILVIVEKMQRLSYFTPTFFETSGDNGCVGYTTTCPATPPTCGSTFGAAGTCSPPTPCTPGVPKNYSSISNNTQGIAIRAGVYPQSMVTGTETSPIISSPWGTGDAYIAVTSTSNSCAANASNVTAGSTLGTGSTGYVPATLTYSGTFALYFENIPSYACAPLLLTFGPQYVSAGLSKICIGAAGSTSCTYGSNITSATTISGSNVAFWCGGLGTSNLSLSLTFSLVHP